MKKLETFLRGEKLKIAVKTNRLLPTDSTPAMAFNDARIVYEMFSNDTSIFRQSVDFSILKKRRWYRIIQQPSELYSKRALRSFNKDMLIFALIVLPHIGRFLQVYLLSERFGHSYNQPYLLPSC